MEVGSVFTAIPSQRSNSAYPLSTLDYFSRRIRVSPARNNFIAAQRATAIQSAPFFAFKPNHLYGRSVTTVMSEDLNQSESIELCDGKYVFLADGWLEGKEIKYGLLAEDLKVALRHNGRSYVAQFYGLVIPGLILTRHQFRGLQRNMYTDGDKTADEQVLVNAWTPAMDFEWRANGRTGSIERRNRPPGRVFVVLCTPNVKHRDSFPKVDCWIDRWNWVEGDTYLESAPQGWVDRYKEKLWTRA